MIFESSVIDRAVEFHGRLCPGLALGIQAAGFALDTLGGDLIAVTENDLCAVDALQAVAGVTVGNGRLIRYDFGKPAWSFYRPGDGSGIRLAGRAVPSGDDRAATATQAERILRLAPTDLFTISEVSELLPRGLTGTGDWAHCAQCDELVLEARARLLDARAYCAPCFRRMKAPIS